MIEKLSSELMYKFKCSFISLENESSKHAGHYIGEAKNTHFKLTIVSEEFRNINLVKRHRLVYQFLESYFISGGHALKMNLLTKSEWKTKNSIRKEV